MVKVIVELDIFVPLHPVNSYPSFGVAVILIDVPLSYVPPEVETFPPSAAVTVKVYWVTEEVVFVVELE